MKSYTANKKNAMLVHMKKRFKERYNKFYSKDIRRDLVAVAKTYFTYGQTSERLTFLEKQSNRVYIFKIDNYYLVYDAMRRDFITAITREMWNEQNHS